MIGMRADRFGESMAPARARSALVTCLCLLCVPGAVPGAARGAESSGVVRVASGADTIPTIRTARGLTTMLSLPEEAREAICGDLFDPQNDTGGFVVQRSGRDLFVKPLRASGRSNLFVKTDRATYAFDLIVGPVARAMRIVYVDDAEPARAIAAARKTLARDRSRLESERSDFEAEQVQARERLEREREAVLRLDRPDPEQIARNWLRTELAATGAVLRVRRPTARSRRLTATLGDAAVTVGGRTYLAISLQSLDARAIEVHAVEANGSHRETVELRLILSPRGSAAIALVFETALARDDTLRLLDADGREILELDPF